MFKLDTWGVQQGFMRFPKVNIWVSNMETLDVYNGNLCCLNLTPGVSIFETSGV